MDDYSISNLYESRNDFTARLIYILTPHIVDGFRSIFDEAWKLCTENEEESKYLMTFQNFLSRVPKWNSTIIEQECERIKERSSCGYIDDLIACVHVVQLKSLTCMRVGMKNKKVNVEVPKVSDFVHSVYINAARKLYTNVYLYERNVHSLQTQRNRREVEIIVQECIMSAMRDTIPIEKLLKSYMDPTIEEDVEISETTSIINQETIVDSANGDGVDVDISDSVMPELAPSRTVTTDKMSPNALERDADAEAISVMEAKEREALKTAETKEIEKMRAVLASENGGRDDDDANTPTSASHGVKFNDDVSVKTDETIGDNGEDSTFHAADDEGDDEDYGGRDGSDRGALQIGDSVSDFDLGIEMVGGGGGGGGRSDINILGDIEVLS
jgi:hypothetical protein